MAVAVPTSRLAAMALVTGLLAVVSSFLAVFSQSDLFVVALLFWALAVIFGVISRIRIWRARGALNGKGLAAWGMGIPAAGFALGFLLLPSV